MNLDAEDRAYLAADAYNDRKAGEEVRINGRPYLVLSSLHDLSGYYGAAYQLETPVGADAQVVIAERGTVIEPLKRPWSTVQGLRADAAMVVGQVNPQVEAAERFTENVLGYAKREGISSTCVTITGHSLGGTLAEIEAARHDLSSATFNAYGAVDLGYRIPEGGNRIVNYVVATDAVSAGGRHYGKVVPLATEADVAALGAAGYVQRHGNVLAVARERLLAAHGIDNFAPPLGKGPSILTQESAALAQQYAGPIAAFRNDALGKREVLHRAARAVEQANEALAHVPGTAPFLAARTRDTLRWGGQVARAAAHRVDRIERAARDTYGAAASLGQRIGPAIGIPLPPHTEVTDPAAARVASSDPRDPASPNHGLYKHLEARIPGLSARRLLQCTAACHTSGMAGENLGQIYHDARGGNLVVLSTSPLAPPAAVNLKMPAPEPQQSIERIQQIDCARAHMHAQGQMKLHARELPVPAPWFDLQ
ncbi:MAG: hypothetical protein ACREPL_15710 [Rhodanobacteraceae bacterium]